MQSPKYVFAYGTLRPGLGSRQEAKDFLAKAKHIGPASFQSKLYLIDWYPGVVESDDATDIVVGDLFEVDPTPEFFHALDTYEGCSASYPQPHEYRRVVRDVTHQGRTTRAWVYLFNWELDGRHTHIKSGDFTGHHLPKQAS